MFGVDFNIKVNRKLQIWPSFKFYTDQVKHSNFKILVTFQNNWILQFRQE